MPFHSFLGSSHAFLLTGRQTSVTNAFAFLILGGPLRWTRIAGPPSKNFLVVRCAVNLLRAATTPE